MESTQCYYSLYLLLNYLSLLFYYLRVCDKFDSTINLCLLALSATGTVFIVFAVNDFLVVLALFCQLSTVNCQLSTVNIALHSQNVFHLRRLLSAPYEHHLWSWS